MMRDVLFILLFVLISCIDSKEAGVETSNNISTINTIKADIIEDNKFQKEKINSEPLILEIELSVLSFTIVVLL